LIWSWFSLKAWGRGKLLRAVLLTSWHSIHTIYYLITNYVTTESALQSECGTWSSDFPPVRTLISSSYTLSFTSIRNPG